MSHTWKTVPAHIAPEDLIGKKRRYIITLADTAVFKNGDVDRKAVIRSEEIKVINNDKINTIKKATGKKKEWVSRVTNKVAGVILLSTCFLMYCAYFNDAVILIFLCMGMALTVALGAEGKIFENFIQKSIDHRAKKKIEALNQNTEENRVITPEIMVDNIPRVPTNNTRLYEKYRGDILAFVKTRHARFTYLVPGGDDILLDINTADGIRKKQEALLNKWVVTKRGTSHKAILKIAEKQELKELEEQLTEIEDRITDNLPAILDFIFIVYRETIAVSKKNPKLGKLINRLVENLSLDISTLYRKALFDFDDFRITEPLGKLVDAMNAWNDFSDSGPETQRTANQIVTAAYLDLDQVITGIIDDRKQVAARTAQLAEINMHDRDLAARQRLIEKFLADDIPAPTEEKDMK